MGALDNAAYPIVEHCQHCRFNNKGAGYFVFNNKGLDNFVFNDDRDNGRQYY